MGKELNTEVEKENMGGGKPCARDKGAFGKRI